MKKVTLTGKLSLNKETVSKLNNEQMNVINGGGPVKTPACQSYYRCCAIASSTSFPTIGGSNNLTCAI